MYSITIKAVNGQWVTVHTDPEVIELMETDTIPTPFTTAIPAQEVLDRITELNPDRRVTL